MTSCKMLQGLPVLGRPGTVRSSALLRICEDGAAWGGSVPVVDRFSVLLRFGLRTEEIRLHKEEHVFV